jgi:uncharacterized protein (DUF1778 family)
MRPAATTAEVNIHLRARQQDRDLIDQAAALIGSNRSQFMLGLALKEAKNVLLDQTSIVVDSAEFHRVLEWMDAPPTTEEIMGRKRLMSPKIVWGRD